MISCRVAIGVVQYAEIGAIIQASLVSIMMHKKSIFAANPHETTKMTTLKKFNHWIL
jgi:hypothetical protein